MNLHIFGAAVFALLVSSTGACATSGGDSPSSDGGSEGSSTTTPTDTGPNEVVCPNAEGLPISLPPGFVADEAYYYFGTLSEIRRMPIEGGPPERLADTSGSLSSPLAVGDSHLFFTSDARAWRLHKAGGEPQDLGMAPGQTTQVATNGEALYFASIGDQAIELRRAVTVNGTSEVLATVTTEGVERLAADGTHLYWLGTQPAIVHRVPVAGGPPEVVADSISEMQAIITGHGLALTDGEVLWSATYQSFDDGRLFAIPKAGGERRVVSDFGLITGFDLVDQTLYAMITGNESRIVEIPVAGGPQSVVACVADRVFNVTALESGVLVYVDGEMRFFSRH